MVLFTLATRTTFSSDVQKSPLLKAIYLWAEFSWNKQSLLNTLKWKIVLKISVCSVAFRPTFLSFELKSFVL